MYSLPVKSGVAFIKCQLKCGWMGVIVDMRLELNNFAQVMFRILNNGMCDWLDLFKMRS